MGKYRSKQNKLRNPLFQADFGKYALDALFPGWYSIRFYKPDATREEILKKRLQVLKLKDNKNNNRYHLNQRRLILHDTIQKVTS